MEDFSDILNSLSKVEVEKIGNRVVVTGFHGRDLAKDISKVWNTTRIANNIFLTFTGRKIEFYEFYALEVVYMLETLLETKRTRTSNMALRSVVDAIKANTWLKDIDNPALLTELNWTALRTRFSSTFTPKEAQMEWFKKLATFKQWHLEGMFLSADPGTGKTYMGVATSVLFDAELTFIFCPGNAVNEVWEEHMHRAFKKPPKYWVSSVAQKPVTTQPKGDEEFIICHYDHFDKIVDTLTKMAKGKRFAIWIDESHNLNEITAQRTQKLIDLATQKTKPISCVWASGTSFKAFGKEVIPGLLTFCQSQFSMRVADSFNKIFGSARDYALDILARRINMVSHKIEKSSVLDVEKEEVEMEIEIPNGSDYTMSTVTKLMLDFVQERATYYTELRPEYESRFAQWMDKFRRNSTVNISGGIYNLNTYVSYCEKMHTRFNQREDKEKIRYCREFEERFLWPTLDASDKKEFRHIASVYKYLVLVIRGEALGRILTRQRIACFNDMVPYANLDKIVRASRKKTIIFTSYNEVASSIYEELKAKGLNPVIVNGNTKSEFERNIAGFKHDKRVNPVIANYKTLATAVPMTEASTIVLFDTPFRDYIRNQAISRAWRLDQDTLVTVISVLLKTGQSTNLSTRNKDILSETKAIVDRMLGINPDSDVYSDIDENFD